MIVPDLPNYMDWTAIETQADADALLWAFGGFHDACIREAHIWTEHWVNEELAMAISTDLDMRVRLLVQRQARPVSAVELVTRFNLVPAPENYAGSIFEATLLVRAPEVYWADEAGWAPDEEDSDAVTWIGARKMRWRDASAWMGHQLRYGPGDSDRL